MEVIDFSQLEPYLQKLLNVIALNLIGGIGKKISKWFNSLFLHQRKNILDWLQKWKPTEDDIQEILNNEDLRFLLSKIFYEVSNEIYKEKLKYWATITDSIVRNKTIPLNTKALFIKCLSNFEDTTIYFLAKLYSEPIKYDEVFSYTNNKSPEPNSKMMSNQIGQLQANNVGFTSIHEQPEHITLSKLGREFIDIISESNKE